MTADPGRPSPARHGAAAAAAGPAPSPRSARAGELFGSPLPTPGGDAAPPASGATEPPPTGRPPAEPSAEPAADPRPPGLFDATRRRDPGHTTDPDHPAGAEDPAVTDPSALTDPPRPTATSWSPDRGWPDRPGASRDLPPTDLPPTDLPPAGRAPAGDVPAPARRATGSPARPGSLTRRLAWTLLPATVAVLCAALVSGAAIARSGTHRNAERELAAAATAQRVTAGTVDALWSEVLGVVAAGVGQEVATAREVQALVGELRAGNGTGAPTPDDLPSRVEDDLERAATARRGFADAVDEVVGRSGSDPIELGNELSALSDHHRAARTSTVDAAESLDAAAETDGRAADRLRLTALGALAVGLLAAAAALAWARRRFRDGVDLPVARLHDAVHRVGAGESPVRSRAGGLPELASLGTAFDEVIGRLDGQLEDLRRRAEWSQQSRLIVDALDMADDEAALFDVVSRALAVVDPSRPVELLLTDRGPSRLTAVATNPHLDPPGTPVDSAGACVALRRGQVAVFESSSSINACPMLRQRPGGDAESGACIPVAVAGKPAGVIHMTGPEMHPPEPYVVERLVSLASQVGNRLGALRTLERTRHQATTDGLTGLPNRRSLEAGVAGLLERGTPFVLVIADLDKFKRLNDTYGHEIGDRALQLFAGVLQDNVRGNDLVARLGGEEFVLVYPNMSVEISIEAIGRLRAALAKAVATSHLPPFTCSFGITHSSVGEDLEAILRIADAGLLRAKELGGDQAVFADADLAAAVFADGPGGSDDDLPPGGSRRPPAAPPPQPPVPPPVPPRG